MLTAPDCGSAQCSENLDTGRYRGFMDAYLAKGCSCRVAEVETRLLALHNLNCVMGPTIDSRQELAR